MTAILITGGAGFIGCRLAERLLVRGCDVFAADSLHPQVHSGNGRPSRLPSEAVLLPADVTSSACWDAVLKIVSPEVVVHLAAETGTGQSLTETTRHGMVNVVGTTQMLDALSRARLTPAIVLASSRAVYGEGRWLGEDGAVFQPAVRSHDDLSRGRWDPLSPSGVYGLPLPSDAETTAPRPGSIYGATKLAQEHLCGAWASATGVPLSVLRLQNVYGPGQSLLNRHTGVLAVFARRALDGQVLDVYEDGNIVRDFVYVDDVVDALVAAVVAPAAGARTLDVGSGRSVTIADAASLVACLAGAPEPVVSGRFRDGDVRAACCTLDRARLELGYRPSITLDQGLEKLVEFAQADRR